MQNYSMKPNHIYL